MALISKDGIMKAFVHRTDKTGNGCFCNINFSKFIDKLEYMYYSNKYY